MEENSYLIYQLKSDVNDPQAVYAEIHGVIDSFRMLKKTKTPAELYEQFGPEVANWLVFTNLDTLKIDNARTQDGKYVIGLHGDHINIEPIF